MLGVSSEVPIKALGLRRLEPPMKHSPSLLTYYAPLVILQTKRARLVFLHRAPNSFSPVMLPLSLPCTGVSLSIRTSRRLPSESLRASEVSLNHTSVTTMVISTNEVNTFMLGYSGVIFKEQACSRCSIQKLVIYSAAAGRTTPLSRTYVSFSHSYYRET